MELRVYIIGISSDEGSVVVFDAISPEGEPIQFACDHRPAQNIASAIRYGHDIEAVIEDWMLVG
jgi:hypothetical protein